MADNLTTQSTSPATVPSSTQIATDDVAGVHFQRVKLVDGTADSSAGIPGDATNGLDVDVTRVQGVVHVDDNGRTLSVDDGGGSLTVDGTVGVSGSVAVTGPLTDTQLRASAVPVSGPLTDTQLRATAVPVSGTVTITDGSGPVTVDGSVSVSNFPATQPVSGTVTVQDGGGSITVDGTVGVSGTVTVDGSAVTQPVSVGSLPLPSGAATSANQATANTSLASIDTKVATAANQTTGNTSLSNIDGKLPTLTNAGTTMPVDIKNTSVQVTGALTDAQLRASNVNVSVQNTSVVVDGRGTAGTPTGGVVTVQGTGTSGALPVSLSGQSVSITNTPTVDTELPTAAALADGVSNPTVPTVGAALVGYNGTTWDRVRVTSADSVTVTQTPVKTGGLSVYRYVGTGTSADTKNAVNGQCNLFGYILSNTGSAPAFVKLYNTSSSPTVGLGTNLVLTLIVPGNTAGAGHVAAEFTNGIQFASGIGHTIVTTAPDTGSTLTGANEVVINLLYKA